MQTDTQPLRRRLIMAGRLHKSVPRKPSHQMIIDVLQSNNEMLKESIRLQDERIEVQSATIALQDANCSAMTVINKQQDEQIQMLLEQVRLMQEVTAIDEEFGKPMSSKDRRTH